MDTLTIQQEDVEAVSPGGSPITHKKLLNFLTVNGGFEVHATSSHASSTDSSACSSPVGADFEDDEIVMKKKQFEFNEELEKVKDKIQRKWRQLSKDASIDLETHGDKEKEQVEEQEKAN